ALSALGAKTTGVVTVSDAVVISGTAAEVKAALVTADTLVQAGGAKVTITDTISVAEVNAIAAKTTGVVTATITDTAAATLAGLTGTGSAYSVTVTGTASAADLNTIDSKTTVAVNATGVTAITGTAADFATLVAAASATPATITLKPDFTATVSGFIAVAEVNAVAAKTTGVVTATLTTGNLQSFAALTETGNAYTITLTDTSADIADLIAMNERTSVPVDAQSVATITSASTTIIDLTAAGVTWKSGITVSGTAGSDSINATAGNDSITGGAGNDSITAGAGNDTIVGADSGDTIVGGVGSDTLQLSGNYTPAADGNLQEVESVVVTGNAAAVTVNLSNQSEAFTVLLSGLGDSVTTGSGNDTITGGLGADSISAGAGNDVIVGADSGDT
ncbi:MAG: calcium-binding protein, partial [Betaproteobacteria bacterium]|nr:calcium-binding protein [Betaproteobacteria bacterium]